MKVKFTIFQSYMKSWKELFEEAAEFASSLDPGRLINISHSCDHNTGTVTVWYWDK